MDVARRFRVVLGLAANVLHVRVDRPRERIVRVSLDFAQELKSGEDLSWMPSEVGEKVELRRREVDGTPLDLQLARLEIDLKLSGDHSLGLRSLAVEPSQDGANPRHELTGAERFDDVVVGPKLQAHNTIGLRGFGGQHDDGHGGLRSDGSGHFQPAHLRQHEVEDDEVGTFLVERLQRRSAVIRCVGLEALVIEVRLDRPDDHFFVIYDEDSFHSELHYSLRPPGPNSPYPSDLSKPVSADARAHAAGAIWIMVPRTCGATPFARWRSCEHFAELPFARVANTILQAAIGRMELRGRMRRLLIVSTEEHSGKSLLSLGLGRALQARGVSVAYMKPISYEVSYATGEPIDRDAAAIRSLLSLEDDVHDIAPIPLEGPFLREAIESGDRGFRQRIAEAFERISSGRGAVLVEGRGFLGMGMSAGLSDLDLADLLGCDVLLLTRYDGEEAIDRILCALRLFEQGPSVLGVILKDVPLDRSYSLLGEVLSSFLADRGAEVLGIIPHDPNLRYVGTDEIARRLGGRTLTHFEGAREVRHFVIGASGIEPSLRSFRRTPEFAVITGGDQTDLQLAALDVPELRCLVLTGDQRPSRTVIDRADKSGVPVILAGQNTLATATLCSSMLERFWVLPGPSLEYAVDHVRSNIDVERILEKTRDD